MVGKKAKLAIDSMDIANKEYELKKIHIKSGKSSGISEGKSRKIYLAKKPELGSPLIGYKKTKSSVNGHLFETSYELSTPVKRFTAVDDLGLVIETETSILILK